MIRATASLLAILLLSLATAFAEDGSTAEVEPNDTLMQPQPVELSARIAGSLKSAADADWFEFRLEKAGFIRASLSAIEGLDPYLTLHDGKRRHILRMDGQGPGRGEELIRRLRRGRYLVGVLFRMKDRSAFRPGLTYEFSVEIPDLRAYEPSMADIKSAIRRGLRFLAGRQEEDGSLPALIGERGVTGLALMAFVGEKLPEFEENVERMAGLFRSSYVPPGSFPRSEHQEATTAGSLVGRQTSHFMYEQAIAVLAMAEYVHHHPDEETRAMVREGVKLLLRSQNTAAKPKLLRGPVPPDHKNFGAWRYRPEDKGGDISVSGWCLIALAAAEQAGFEVPRNVREDYMRFCRSCFNEKLGAYTYAAGGSGPQTNTTNSIGVLTTLLCVGGDCPVVRIGLREIRRNFPGWEMEGGRGKYPFYYWYYASRAMYVAGGDYWKEWRGAILPMLLKHQNEDGSWDAALDEEKVGLEYTTSLAVLILQLCSGNPPSYLKGLELKTEAYSCPTCLEDIEKLIDRAERERMSREDLIKELRTLLDRYYGGE